MVVSDIDHARWVLLDLRSVVLPSVIVMLHLGFQHSSGRTYTNNLYT